MTNAKQQQHSIPFSITFFSGAVAGISEILLMYPLDVVKTRSQLKIGKMEGFMSHLSLIVKKEG